MPTRFGPPRQLVQLREAAATFPGLARVAPGDGVVGASAGPRQRAPRRASPRCLLLAASVGVSSRTDTPSLIGTRGDGGPRRISAEPATSAEPVGSGHAGRPLTSVAADTRVRVEVRLH